MSVAHAVRGDRRRAVVKTCNRFLGINIPVTAHSAFAGLRIGDRNDAFARIVEGTCKRLRGVKRNKMARSSRINLAETEQLVHSAALDVDADQRTALGGKF